MSTPKMEINNLLSVVAVGNPQSVQAGTEPGGGNSPFMSLFAGVRNISAIEELIPTGINLATEEITGSEQLTVPAEEPVADEALSLLMGLQQPGSEGGKPLPEVGKGLPVDTDQEMGLPIAAMMTKERPFSMPKEAAEITLKPALPDDSALPVDAELLSEHVTTVEPESFSPLQPGIGYVPEEKLPSTVTDAAPTRVEKGQPPQLKTDSEITVEAVVLPVMSPQLEITQRTPVKSAIDTIALQSVMNKDQSRILLSKDSTGPVLRTVVPEQFTAAITRAETGLESELVATATEEVVEEADTVKFVIDKKADVVMAAAQNAKSIIADRSASLDAIQATQLDARLNELNSTSQKLSQIRNLPETVVLPETLSMRQPNWNQNLGKNILWMVKEDLQSASIRVKPAELGPLNIQISVQQEQLQVSISAQHAGAREALEAALPRLREQFVSQGFQQVNVDISEQQERGTTGHQQSDSDITKNASSQGADSNFTEHENFSEAELTNFRSHDGLLDAFA